MNLQCPACNRKMRLSDENATKFAGRKVKCPSCKNPLVVPAAAAAAPKKAQPLDATPDVATPDVATPDVAVPPASALPPVAAPAAAKPPAAAAPATEAPTAEANPFAGLGDPSTLGTSGIGVASKSATSPAARVKKPKSSSVPMALILVGGGAVAVVAIIAIALIIAFSGGGETIVASSGTGQLNVQWAEKDRAGAKIQVDGKDMAVPSNGPVSYLVASGQHRVVILRHGFDQIETQVVVPERGKVDFQPKFKPLIAPGIDQFAGQAGQGGFNPNANFDHWLQDFEQARAKAAASNGLKDVLILFNESDTNPLSIKMAREVMFDSRFEARIASEYELVHIDFPSGSAAKAKVQNAPRNENLRRRFGIDIFPTVLLTDGDGLPYAKLAYQPGDIFAFSEAVEDAQTMRQARDDYARIAEEEGSWERRMAAAGKFLEIMSYENLEWFYSKKYQQWFDAARQADPNNRFGYNEYFFQWIWMARVFENARMKNDAGIRSAIGELDQWLQSNQFRSDDLAAQLHLLAALTMARLNDADAVKHYAEQGLGYSTRNENLIAGLEFFANADSFNVLGNGTGFVIAPGYVMTNHHVIEGDGKIAVRLPGVEDPVACKVVAQNEKHDLALLQVNHDAMANITPIEISLSPPGRGMNIGVFGYPLSDSLGDELKLTAGIIGATGSSRDDGMLLLNATVNPGNSGGPLCNTAGEVIGIVTAKSIQRSASEDTYGMAVPADRIVTFLEQHLPGYQPPEPPAEEFPDMPPANWAKVDRQISGSVLQVLQLQN